MGVPRNKWDQPKKTNRKGTSEWSSQRNRTDSSQSKKQSTNFNYRKKKNDDKVLAEV